MFKILFFLVLLVLEVRWGFGMVLRFVGDKVWVFEIKLLDLVFEIGDEELLGDDVDGIGGWKFFEKVFNRVFWRLVFLRIVWFDGVVDEGVEIIKGFFLGILSGNWG